MKPKIVNALSKPQTVLVTGASQGIGRYIALQLAAQGHTVIAWARNADLLSTLAAPNIHVYNVDLAQTSALPSLAAQLLLEHPELSGVIHNAAIQNEVFLTAPNYQSHDITEEIAINLVAPIVLTHALLPHLSQQSGAFVCTISSILALAAKRNSAVYCATKAGLHGFSDSLRAQLAGRGVQITEVLPPTVETRMSAHRRVPKMPPETVAACTISAISAGKQTVVLGTGKLFVLLLYLVPSLAKKIMLNF